MLDPLSRNTVAAPVGGSELPTWSPNRVCPVRNRKTVTTWPVASVTDWVSTVMAPLTVDTGVHPGCSVVVVVGGMVVVGAAAVVVGDRTLLGDVVEQPADTAPLTMRNSAAQVVGDRNAWILA
jgi:hypothetical protein